MLKYRKIVNQINTNLKLELIMENNKKENNEKITVQAHGYNGHEPTRICPHCGKEKPLSEFGYRNMGNGEIRGQSWCKDYR